MRQPRDSGVKLLLALGFGAMVLVVAAGLVVATSDVTDDERQDLFAVLALCLTGVAAVAAPLLTRFLGAPSENLDSRLERAAEALTVAVRGQWRAEARLRRLQDPAPMDVRWVRADLGLGDHLHNLRYDAVSGLLERPGGVDELVEAFATCPARRVVILGGAGAGKSVLAIRFTLSLLERLPQGRPLPVIFPLATWDAERVSLVDWLAQRLATDYEALGATTPGGATARELLAREHILPILDGFDELPVSLRPLALRRLNAELDANTPLLLTSRREEYVRVVESTDVLTASTVLELKSVELETACSYLAATAPPLRTPDGRLETAWAPVLERLRQDPEGTPAVALRTVLSSPLMVAMARAICDGSRSEPTRLLDERFRTPQQIEEHLLDAYLPAVYSPSSTAPWTAAQARKWLGRLARHAWNEGDGVVAWWRLEAATPRVFRALAPALFSVLGAWIVLTLLFASLDSNVYAGFWDTGEPQYFLLVKIPWIIGFSLGIALLTPRAHAWPGRRLPFLRARKTLIVLTVVLVDSLTKWLADQEWLWGHKDATDGRVDWAFWAEREGFQLSFGLMTALAFGFFGIRRTPLPVLLPRRGTSGLSARRLGRALLLGTVVGAQAGAVIFTLGALIAEAAREATPTPLASLGLGAAAGGFLGGISVLIGGLFHSLDRPIDVATVATPTRSLRHDRTAALARAAFLATLSGALLFAALWDANPGNLRGGCGQMWLTMGSTALALSAWGRWVAARLWLAARGQLPWRLMAFMQDAHARGVLRQAGAIYQFRHLRLQERLAPRTSSALAPTIIPHPRDGRPGGVHEPG
ncbi:NACHT domain-containing protein [Streptomyces sp. NBC_00576]|uniref:NACHT domain-containing protein n=1 Tax=Streptomyces sp. NBC_00576 TaxID=2903665 RepID=UPI002E8113C9|nr:NACHT domain-containing protein [Streptomyces sp. NBC_00576]WUB70046.1 NACHT domain-containing protein [Streptomyces sp. NBC_00576]